MIFKFRFLFQTLDPEIPYSREEILDHAQRLGMVGQKDDPARSALSAFLAVLPFLVFPTPLPAEMTGNGWMAFLAALKVDRLKGRPPEKYDDIRKALVDSKLYSPASIAQRFFPEDETDRQRCRRAHHRYAYYHQFPPAGDGILRPKGKRATPAWFGWRWKLPPGQ